ncbi:MAG: taurine dioxygenase [Rhodospirillaceae bacterium]|jgi:taurine dioxygenase|nr:taurine dioxygenase [Rhodospirillaceae bacterium]MBT3494266.1 taurine dioxygenase [Rhodospirillaceae bacterium]MBT3778654.1 taurine dioxygenase [Rhodospirillaceae bacterium]MBT3979193.1 taurine dioxygenase [Rhodospirillaceae bacterium]MBT4170724.1 taurine dioxygenase [Rhodospirillaceae bacterium]
MTTDAIRNSWDVKRLAGALGAEVHGINLAQADAGDIAEVKRLLEEHMVLFFPGQNMSMEEHVALGRPFGPLEGHPNLAERNSAQHPEIFQLSASEGGIADEWHTDLTFQAQPALMSILNMRKCPETGGDTMWTNLCAAYEALSAPMQEMCDGLTALHDAHPHGRADKMTIHPVVRVLPETDSGPGRKALYVNEHFTRRIVEMSMEESNNLLPFLTRWVQSPRFTVRYGWSEGTIGMWDNRCTQHYVLNDFNAERIIQRVTVMGDQPLGAGARWQPWTERTSRSAMGRHDRQLSGYLSGQAVEAAE